ncbi:MULTISPECIES: helix-turn-helix domain-containing protein [unclassified Methylobacterium]|jgi:hypothetical protein|uniref:helix-turn-helix domain-containing protein n=1 Tax=unclassified Methylobacterium TaxID=2615210 RepID=UPI001356239F|nr:helix-turn-helix transcriptional regulator [Methylobacterium sp. 2A]MWV22470.1 helix-turn-helix transcriptional regulator [Methylobacterium sp. 2A]
MARTLSRDDVVVRLKAACVAAGGPAAFAKRVNIRATYLSDQLSGRRPPGPSVLAELGLRQLPPSYESAGRSS